MVRVVTGSWSYLRRSKLPFFHWVGWCDVWAVHQCSSFKLLSVSCNPQSVSSADGCSCNRAQGSCWFLCLLRLRTWNWHGVFVCEILLTQPPGENISAPILQFVLCGSNLHAPFFLRVGLCKIFHSRYCKLKNKYLTYSCPGQVSFNDNN